MNFKDALKEFCDEFDEIHYCVGCGCAGFVLGWVSGSLFTIVLILLMPA